MASELLRVVLDTNVLISAFVYGGNPEIVVRLALSKVIRGVTSSALLAELRDVLHREKFRVSDAGISWFERKISEKSIIVEPDIRLDALRDASDNKVLEAASAGECQFIVTGDRDLLVLGEFQGIGICTPAEFLKHYANAF